MDLGTIAVPSTCAIVGKLFTYVQCSKFHGYKKWTISHIRQLIDDIPTNAITFLLNLLFVWSPYSHERMENIVVPNEVLQHRLTWSATVHEWHASDRHEIPREPISLVEAHNMVLTGPKTKDWRDEHYAYITIWTNRLTSILVGDPVVHYQASEEYMQWYNDTYGAHLRLTGYVPQPQP
ncbi:hypothetical protein Ahy_A04g019151 [Arachis hypogaea]|uniref:Aminotransferase-like plant mobile domain-containing protein n=1 Tax=Arachis hypogaea TaxID=3818 RepID=A0A445DFF5_ARAHY|nr:hypothetical protein Ahy_A04g019151 [Arachis hypogaea]